MIDANRLVYNNMITACKIHYKKTNELPSAYDLNKIGTRMRQNSSYVAQAFSMTLNETARRVIFAFERSMGLHNKEPGILDLEKMMFNLPNQHAPRYKSYNQFNSISYPLSNHYSVIVNKKGRKERRKLKLGKIPGLIRCYNNDTRINGTMKNCIIKRKNMGAYSIYYACIAYEPLAETITEPSRGPIGVDIGIHNIAALSDGTIFPNDCIFYKFKINLKKHQRSLSRTSPGTRQYRKIQTKINHLYEKILNHRKNNTEQISSYLIKNHSHIVMEDLSIEQLRSISLSRFMSNGYNDASLGMLRKRIKDKASSAGREIILVKPKYTSQICSACERIVRKGLKNREHICPYCGYKMDRDVNAAKNILNRSYLTQTHWVDQPPLSMRYWIE